MADRFPQVTAVLGGFILAASGLWAFLAPESFFESAARFEPYNQHFLQDIGSFLVGLGAVLLLASLPTRSDGLALALLGVGLGAMLHAVSHIIGRDLGGKPETDIPLAIALAAVLLVAGSLRWTHTRT